MFIDKNNAEVFVIDDALTALFPNMSLANSFTIDLAIFITNIGSGKRTNAVMACKQFFVDGKKICCKKRTISRKKLRNTLTNILTFSDFIDFCYFSLFHLS